MMENVEFEYYKYLRGKKFWWDYPFAEYNVYLIDTRGEKNDRGLWYEYTEKFLPCLLGQYRWQFIEDAEEWAESFDNEI